MRNISHITYKFLATSVVFISIITHQTGTACPLLLPFSTININGVNLSVEIASTSEARRCGLSNRNTLPENRGMLFVYPESSSLKFWMKDTLLPLSIAFLDYSGRIISIQDMSPMQSTKRYRSPDPAKYAIEVNKGWFTRHQIQIGDVMETDSFLSMKKK